MVLAQLGYPAIQIGHQLGQGETTVEPHALNQGFGKQAVAHRQGFLGKLVGLAGEHQGNGQGLGQRQRLNPEPLPWGGGAKVALGTVHVEHDNGLALITLAQAGQDGLDQNAGLLNAVGVGIDGQQVVLPLPLHPVATEEKPNGVLGASAIAALGQALQDHLAGGGRRTLVHHRGDVRHQRTVLDGQTHLIDQKIAQLEGIKLGIHQRLQRLILIDADDNGPVACHACSVPPEGLG